MISARCLLSLCVLVTFYLIQNYSASFSACDLGNPLLGPNHVASHQVSDSAQFVAYDVLSDAYFSCSTTIQVLSDGSVWTKHPSDTATTQYLDFLVHLVPNMSMDVMPAQNLGVSLCCALETGTNTSIAQELGVQNNVMCEIGSNPDFAIFSFLFKLSVLVPSPFESKYTSTTVYQNSQLVNVVGNVVEDHNVGVQIVTLVLDLLHLFEFVVFALIRCTCIVICCILMYFTPCNNLFMITCCFTSLKTVFEKCRQLRAIILQNLFRRHDFVVFWVMFCRVQRFTIFFMLASLLFAMVPALDQWSIVDVCVNEPCVHDTLSGAYVGGGRIPLFNLDELLPYVDTSGKCLEPMSKVC